ncbi:hypothetical protein [Persephonella sp.]
MIFLRNFLTTQSNISFLFGIVAVLTIFTFHIANDFYITYQNLVNNMDKTFLNPYGLKHLSTNGAYKLLIWICILGLITILGIFIFRKKRLNTFYTVSSLFVLALLKMFFTEPLEIYGSIICHCDRYFLGLDLSIVLFLFVPYILFLSKTDKEKMISFFLIIIGFLILYKVHSLKGMFFYFISVLLSLIFLVKENKRHIYSLFGLSGMFVILGILKGSSIVELLKNRIDPYFDNILLTMYTKEISFLPKNDVLYSTKTAYNLWSDFVPLYILEKFGWILGILILLFPIFIFIQGLLRSIKNLKKSHERIVFVLSVVLLIYTVISLLPLKPYFPKFGLNYPLYGYITGFAIMWIYLVFAYLFYFEKSKNL